MHAVSTWVNLGERAELPSQQNCNRESDPKEQETCRDSFKPGYVRRYFLRAIFNIQS